MNAWTSVLHEKLIGPQWVMKFLTVYGTRGLLSHAQQPALYSCPEADKSRTCPSILLLYNPV